ASRAPAAASAPTRPGRRSWSRPSAGGPSAPRQRGSALLHLLERAGSELEARAVLPRLDLLERPLVAGRADEPLAVLLHVLVVVESGAADLDLRARLDDDVVEGPDALGGGGAGQLDLGVMHA